MARKTSDNLIEKSVHSLISAIEVYNKPDFKYREENFCILMVNAWELLLKARILEDNNNDKKCLYIKDYPINKDGTRSKRFIYRTTNSGNYLTKEINTCIKELRSNNSLDERAAVNLLSLIEIRNTSIHYYNTSLDYVKKTHELGSASIHAFIIYLNEWFDYQLNNYHLYLLPLSFFGSDQIEAVPTYSQEIKLLEYINSLKNKYPYDKSNKVHYSFEIQISLTKKSKGTSSVYLSNDPSAPKVYLSDEELAKKYPLSYDKLVDICRSRYSDFLQNNEFYETKGKYEDDLKYCYQRYPGLGKTGSPRKHYNSAILEEFDKKYTKIQ